MRRPLCLISVLLVFLALATSATAQPGDTNLPSSTPPASTTLLRLLQSKGIVTEQEAASLRGAPLPEIEQRLGRLLLAKGVLSQQEYTQAFAPEAITVARVEQTPVMQVAKPAPPPPAAAIPAVAPLRVLPITVPKKDGIVPDIKLGTAARLQPYGFFKISSVYQSASHGGPVFGSNDFPQGPLLLGDTGPDGDGQFHVKDRGMRLGVNFEWPDVSKNLTLTGKLEFDFEGNFTNVNNRNISANRSSQPSLRLAWVRLDSKAGSLPWFVQFGQDWSIFGSSTLMDLFETTGFGFAQGNLYERQPMFRTGVQFGKGDFKVQPEFAIVLPSFGEPGLDDDQRTRFGGRAGPEGRQPELQSRLVFQFPLSRAAGVLPAQIIFSYDHAQRAEIVPLGNLPVGAIRSAFPQGLRLTSQRNAWSAEMQLPTPYATLVGKYYRGGDLRYFFMGQFNDIFTDLGGRPAIPVATPITSFTGRVIPFASAGGSVIAPRLEPVMGQGGFLQLGLPLSKIFGANPAGRNSGWTLYLTYGVDSAFARDAIRANGLLRTDHASVQLRYKINRWASFVNEETYLATRTAGGIAQRKLFRGVPVHTVHAWRSEFGPLFTF